MRLVDFLAAMFLAVTVIACQTGKNHISSNNNENTATDQTNTTADSNNESQDNNTE
ncbi:MAG: hypothetical protein JW841_00270 [Deltaproteobacteria bacterium]|nr:hypothetical protein [Deltaproteobacteria bacterium]